jgi:uncharacterized protein (TIGR00255 family)
MIVSMTGYGKGEGAAGNAGITVEIRSVNHRYGEVTIKLPRGLVSLENEIRKTVSERIRRGKVEVCVQLEERSGEEQSVGLNLPLAAGYHSALTRLRDELGIGGEIPLSLVAGQRDVLVAGERRLDEDELAPGIVATVKRALENHDVMRRREGALLMEDLLSRRVVVGSLIDNVRERAPAVVTEQLARLKERTAVLLEGTPVDEARLLQEMVLLADRSDVTEEIVRFSSHLQQFDETLSSDDAVGRKLDFLLQEMNREINTIGSKANDAALSSNVVAAKVELEKIREQVQNVE